MAADGESRPMMDLKIKTTTTTYDVSVPENATVGELKTALTTVCNEPVEKLCLIFSGKILQNDDKLESHGVKNGMSVHLVLRNSTSANRPAAAAQSSATPNASATSGAQRTNTGNTARPTGTSNIFANLMSGGAAPSPNQMAEQMMQNPDMMRDMLNNPLMQHIVNSPEMLRSLFMENPQIQGIIQQNPELGHLLNDPEVLRQTIEMVRNPNMFQEMMRNHDQAIRNLQGIPGGEAALQRLYRDLQEPLLNSATNSLAGNPFASLVDNNSATSRSQRAGVENAEALPNPWGAGSPNSASTPGAASGTSATPAGATASIMNSPGIQDLMRQMMSNPESLQSMMRNPAVQGIANSLRQNPEELREILGQSMEMFARPEIRDQVRQAFPNVFDQLTQAPPEVLGSFANPRVQEALRDIQRGYTVLREEAPELFTFASRATAAATGTGGNTEAGAANPAALGDIFRNMLNLNEASSGNAANLPPPQERFRQQLDDLQQMGFDNEAANIQALIASLGDVSGAIEFLLNRAGGQ